MSRGAKVWTVALGSIAMVTALAVGVVSAAEDKDAKKRAEIDATATKTLNAVLGKSKSAKELYGKSVGYAAFNNVKVAVIVSGGGGDGVAVPKKGARTYMKMGTVGVGLGLGGQKYQVLFLFETEDAMKSFVEKGWQADTSAQASAGEKGANVGAAFKNGVAVFQMTDKGLMASADIAGTKYWKNEDLNK